MYCMCKCVYWSVCRLICQSSHCLRSSLRIPLKVLLSLSSQSNDTPRCHLTSFSLPWCRFPSLSFPDLSLHWPLSRLPLCQRVLPAVAFFRLLAVCPYQFFFFFSVSGPCLVNLEVSLCPSHPYPPSMDKHIGHVGPSVKGSSHKRPSPSPQIWAVQYTDGWVSHSPSSCWLTWGCG